MPAALDDAISDAKKQRALLRASDLGVPAYALVHAEAGGAIERVVQGVYLPSGARRELLTEAAAWCLRQPASVCAMLTAAAHHDLTDAFEQGTWLFVPKGASPPRSSVSVVRTMVLSPLLLVGDDAELGIETVVVHRVPMRITGADRTVLDLWRYPKVVAREHALAALRRHTRRKGFRLPVFARIAKRIGVWKTVEPVLQGMLA